MRRIIASEMVTADGFFAGPGGELDWHVVDAGFNEYAVELLNAADLLLFGRVTYQLMADYWTTPAAIKNDPVVAGKMNQLPKIVFSRTQQHLAWNNCKLMTQIVPEEVTQMKQQSGGDIVILGSGTIVSALARLDLMDEYRLIVSPIVLGRGKKLLGDLDAKLRLKLLWTKATGSGNVLLCYGPD